MFMQESLPDDVDDFEEFRTRSSELVRDTVFIVGASDVFCQASFSHSVTSLNSVICVNAVVFCPMAGFHLH